MDDDARVRRALRGLIGCASELTVVGQAGSMWGARRLDVELAPDVVVLDLLLPPVCDAWGPAGAPRPGPPGGGHQLHGRAGPPAMVAGAHALLEQHGREVDELLDMVRAVYRHHPGPQGA